MRPSTLSVIVDAASMQDLVLDAISSVVAQNYRDVQLYVIINSENLELMDKIWNAYNKQVRFIQRVGEGYMYRNRRFSIRLLKTDFVQFVAPGFSLLPNSFYNSVRFLEKYPSFSLVGAGCELISEFGIFIRDINYPQGNLQIQIELLKNLCFCSSSIVFRSSAISNREVATFFSPKQLYLCLVQMSFRNKMHNLSTIAVRSVANKSQHSFINIDRESIIKIRMGQLSRLALVVTSNQQTLYLKLLDDCILNEEEYMLCVDLLNSILEKNKRSLRYQPKQLYSFFKELLINSVKYRNVIKVSEGIQLGGWAIEESLIRFIHTNIDGIKNILEFGSGEGTSKLLENYSVTSVEHNKDYVIKRSVNHECRFAALQNGWYDRKVVTEVLKKVYDLILVDGPPGYYRSGILDNLDLFEKVSCPIVFDDANRNLDFQTVLQFCNNLGYRFNIHSGQTKSFAFCQKLIDNASASGTNSPNSETN